MAKGLKLKVRKFLGLVTTFVEVTGEKLVGEGGGGGVFPPNQPGKELREWVLDSLDFPTIC